VRELIRRLVRCVPAHDGAPSNPKARTLDEDNVVMAFAAVERSVHRLPLVTASAVRATEAQSAKNEGDSAETPRRDAARVVRPDAAKTTMADLIADMQCNYRINGRNEQDVLQRWEHLKPTFGTDLALAVTMRA